MAPKDTAAIATYGDHEVIVPENKLRKAISNKPAVPGEDDPVSRASSSPATGGSGAVRGPCSNSFSCSVLTRTTSRATGG